MGHLYEAQGRYLLWEDQQLQEDQQLLEDLLLSWVDFQEEGEL